MSLFLKNSILYELMSQDSLLMCTVFRRFLTKGCGHEVGSSRDRKKGSIVHYLAAVTRACHCVILYNTAKPTSMAGY